MSISFETVSSTASFLRTPGKLLPVLDALDYFQIDADFASLPSNATSDMHYLHDLVARILHRGVRTMPSLAVERLLVSLYGDSFGLKEKETADDGGVEWHVHESLLTAAHRFADYLSGWVGDPDLIPLDPSHPVNERRLLKQLLGHYGSKLASCMYTQVHLSDLLPTEDGNNFLAQRVDFLIALPNGRCIVLEPGDHEMGQTPLAQKALDRQRDKSLTDIGIYTLRFANARIGTDELMADIDELIEKMGGHPFLGQSEVGTNETQITLSHLLLLPTLIARLEHVLATVFLQRGLLSQERLSVCIIEQDLECAEIALYSFLERLQQLAALYRIELPLPTITLVIVRSGNHSCADLSQIASLLYKHRCAVEVIKDIPTTSFDLSIDVAIMANYLTTPVAVSSISHAVIRNAFPHSKKHRFAYSARPREITLEDEDQSLLETFLVDFFRKKKLRPGQFPIIKNILAQKATIGLLPTSAGKSICFQLASILTPGITLVIDPIVFLMKDQVLGLSEQYGITAIAAWNSEAGLYRDDQVGELMATSLMIFLSPERFLRPTFRSAMQNLMSGDLFVNYAVIDEAHCVSMWGHDFRPSYLMLERCFREYCSLGGRQPVVVALTGTASQLVLIDLKRQLNIEEMESIFRPISFGREELIYHIVPSRSNDKKQALNTVLHAIERRLGIQDVKREAWGILFANIPNQVWELYGELAGDADGHVTQIATGSDITKDLSCGMACGGKPKSTPVTQEHWKEYKNKILPHFKRGKVRMLIGNAAIGVGIDNEYVNYVVVYCMPASLESLAQQWGRAGRSRQTSQCYLINSDDQHAVTDRWLNGELTNMPNRYDDLGTISWFHSSAFPGEQKDTVGTFEVLRQIFRSQPDNDGRRAVREDGQERVQRYLSFLIMMGLVEDYEATGIGTGTRYRVALPRDVENAIIVNDNDKLKGHLVTSLHAYLSRYRPTTEKEILDGLMARPEERLSGKAVGYLVNFIYSSIAYQRKESIRTIVGFCRENDLSSEAIQRRMKAFFDRNPKFSDRLDAMALEEISITSVMGLVILVEGYDDAEHLFWETRRLLDERFRADWAAVNLFSVIYREKTISRNYEITFYQMIAELEKRLSAESRTSFLVGFFNGIVTLDHSLRTPVSNKLLPILFHLFYQRAQIACLQVLDGVTCDPETEIQIRALIATNQMEGLLNVVKHKYGLG